MKRIPLILALAALLWPTAGSAAPVSDQNFPTEIIPAATDVTLAQNGVRVTLSSTWVARTATTETDARDPKPAISLQVTSDSPAQALVWIGAYLTHDSDTHPGEQRFMRILHPTEPFHFPGGFEADFRVVDHFETGEARTYEGFHYWAEYRTANEVRPEHHNGIVVFVLTSGGFEMFRFNAWDLRRPALAGTETLDVVRYPVTPVTGANGQPLTFLHDGFENGLDGWETTGHVTLPHHAYPAPRPAEKNRHALLVADGTGILNPTVHTPGARANPYAPPTRLADFIGIEPTLLPLPATTARRGVAIRKQNVVVAANSRLTAQVNVMTAEDDAAGNRDRAFFFAKKGSDDADLTSIAVNRATDGPAFSDIPEAYYRQGIRFNRGTGYRSFTHTFEEAGTYTIGFGVVNSGDNAHPSGMLLDQIRLHHPSR